MANEHAAVELPTPSYFISTRYQGGEKMIRLPLLTIMALGLYLSSASLDGARNCTTWTPPQQPEYPILLPYPTSILHLGHRVVLEAEMELLLPQHFTLRSVLVFRIYNKLGEVGKMELITIPGTVVKETVRVWCAGGNKVEVPVTWYTPAKLMKGLRHAIVQVEANRVTVMEGVEGKTRLVGSITCSKSYHRFTDLRVDVQCWVGDCPTLQLCKEETPTSSTATPNKGHQTTLTAVLVLTAGLVVVVVVVFGFVAAARRAARRPAWHLRFGSPQVQVQPKTEDDTVYLEPISVTPTTKPFPTIPRDALPPAAQLHFSDDEEEHIYAEAYVY